MRVLVWVHHELDSTLNSLLLLPLADLVENGMEYLIDPALCRNSHNDIDHLMLHILCIQVNIIIDCHVSNYSIHDPPDEANIGIGSILLGATSRCRFPTKLLFGLLEHLGLLGSHALPFNLLLLTNRSLVLGDLRPSALAAPSLALPRFEVVGPGVPPTAMYLNHSEARHMLLRHQLLALIVFIVNHGDLNPATMAQSLGPHSLNNLDAIMAYLMPSVRKLPESDLAPIARLFRDVS